jgi:HAD superfamily hydrolase (TIGR01509 family)
MNKIKGIIFDLDGTLINSEHFYFTCWNIVLKKYNIQFDFNTYIKEYAGLSMRDNAHLLVKTYNLKVDPNILSGNREKIANSFIENSNIELLPHTLDALDFFKSAYCNIYLVTSSKRRIVDKILTIKGLKKYFEFSITNDDVMNKKPHPEPYLKAVKMSQLKPSELIVFEDTESGIKAAKAAQLRCFAVQNKKELKKGILSADLMFDDFAQAVEHIKNQKLVGR